LSQGGKEKAVWEEGIEKKVGEEEEEGKFKTYKNY